MRRLPLTIAAISLAWAAESTAQIRFESPFLTQLAGGAPTLDWRARLSVGDLNQDGIPDVVAPSQLGALVLLGRGDGTTSLPITAGGNAPFSAIADFDGDGHPDIAWADGVTYGNGSGENWETVQIAAVNAGGVVAADFDGDGRMDFAVSQYPDRIQTFLSRPSRTFQSVVGVTGMPQASNATAMRVCDLNRDGRPDIALCLHGDGDDDFIALIGVGDGTFVYRPHPISGPEPFGLGVEDFTGDGIPDIVLAQRFQVSLFPGVGDGSFAAPQVAAFDTLNERDLAVGDVTGDGLPDLVTSDFNGGRLLVRAGLGNGTFGARIVTEVDMDLLGLELADMNGDGRLDVVSLCEGKPGVVVALGDGRGRFGARLPRLATTDSPLGIAIGDLNGDGRPDVVASTGHEAASSLEAFLNEGGRSHGAPVVTTLLDPGQRSPWKVHLADLDRDSRLDAVVDFLWSVQTALGNGDGTFRARASMAFPTYQEDVCVADVNGDSIPDLIGTSATGLRVWPGLGDGTFGEAIDSPMPGSPARIAVGDLNGDGIADVGVATWVGVTHALGVGDGSFVPDPDAWTPSSPYAQVVVGDITGDGRDDLLGMKAEIPYCGTTLLCSHVASRLQDSTGAMGPWLDTRWLAAGSPRIADVNGDGFGDLVYTTDLGFGVALSDANGRFTIEPGCGTGDMSDIRVADLDGDGRTDVAIAEPGGVAIYYGRDPTPPLVGIPERRAPDNTRGTRILSAYPNPSRSGLRVRFRVAGPGPVALSLFDLAGRNARTLYRGVLESGSGGREEVASVSDLSVTPGLYFLRLVSSTGGDTRRLAVVR